MSELVSSYIESLLSKHSKTKRKKLWDGESFVFARKFSDNKFCFYKSNFDNYIIKKLERKQKNLSLNRTIRIILV